MKVRHLIQPHRMPASRQQNAPANEAANTGGPAVLSIARLVSRDECREKPAAVASFPDRRSRKLDETRERFAGNALNVSGFDGFEAMAVSVGFVTGLELSFRHLPSREGRWLADCRGSSRSAVHG